MSGLAERKRDGPVERDAPPPHSSEGKSQSAQDYYNQSQNDDCNEHNSSEEDDSSDGEEAKEQFSSLARRYFAPACNVGFNARPCRKQCEQSGFSFRMLEQSGQGLVQGLK